MFEKVFPELKSKSEQLRDQASRFSRYGYYYVLYCFKQLVYLLIPHQGWDESIWCCEK